MLTRVKYDVALCGARARAPFLCRRYNHKYGRSNPRSLGVQKMRLAEPVSVRRCCAQRQLHTNYFSSSGWEKHFVIAVPQILIHNRVHILTIFS